MISASGVTAFVPIPGTNRSIEKHSKKFIYIKNTNDSHFERHPRIKPPHYTCGHFSAEIDPSKAFIVHASRPRTATKRPGTIPIIPSQSGAFVSFFVRGPGIENCASVIMRPGIIRRKLSPRKRERWRVEVGARPLFTRFEYVES